CEPRKPAAPVMSTVFRVEPRPMARPPHTRGPTVRQGRRPWTKVRAMPWVLALAAAAGVLLIARFVRGLDDPHALARAGHVHRLRALVEHDPSLVRATNADGETPLHVAAKHGE